MTAWLGAAEDALALGRRYVGATADGEPRASPAADLAAAEDRTRRLGRAYGVDS